VGGFIVTSNYITTVHDRGTKDIYIYNNDSNEPRYKRIQYKDPNNNESEIASEYGQEYKWTKSPEDNQVASITLPRPSRKGNLANVVHLIPVQTGQSAHKKGERER